MIGCTRTSLNGLSCPLHAVRAMGERAVINAIIACVLSAVVASEKGIVVGRLQFVEDGESQRPTAAAAPRVLGVPAGA
jgi:hypothetical protein